MAVSAATYTCQTHRYKKCFNELCTIGKGGYATVYQAQHNLDKGIYAVKKISFRYKSDEKFEKIRCEAERLAQLNHPNVVSYNSAWLEIADDAEAGSECETCSNSESSTGEILDRNDYCLPTENFSATALPVLSLTNNETYHGNVEIPEVVKEKKSQSPGATGFGPLQPNLLRRRRHSSGPTCSDTDFLKEEIMLQNEDNMGCKNIEQPTVKKSDLRVNFYIQMEYCNHDLNFWLSSQNSNTGYSVANEQKPVEVFHQILCGVEYIHSQSVIHRDLKPSNIFILAKQVAKIGDFGLACLVDQTNDSAIENLSYTRGTPPYAAPEQKKSHKYDSKVDIYSLGIVLLELLHPCETRQEFCRLVENAGNGIFPSYLNQNRREYVKLITQMMNIDPVKRPTATEILHDPLFKTKNANRRIEEIKHRLVKLSEEQKELAKITCDLQAEQNGLLRESMSDNKELRGQNSAQKEEIENLRKELAEHCV